MKSDLLTPDHLQRAACVYIRQSTPQQVRNNLESQRLQYGLVTYARELGFVDVRVIDDDLGTTASGVERPGFDQLVVAVGKSEVGLVLATDASRLARNGRDWEGLLDFCAVVGCLVGDRDRLYDPGAMEDRMYLGLRGAFNQFELSMFRKRSQESIEAKAQRGELFLHAPAGYDRVGRDAIEMSPDQNVRNAIRLVFDTFDAVGSLRQTWLWFHNNQVEIPVRMSGRGLIWRIPAESSITQILRNPIYAGTYAYGRKQSETTIRDGRKTVVIHKLDANPAEWKVLLPGLIFVGGCLRVRLAGRLLALGFLAGGFGAAAWFAAIFCPWRSIPAAPDRPAWRCRAGCVAVMWWCDPLRVYAADIVRGRVFWLSRR